jgi:hypothetical protein
MSKPPRVLPRRELGRNVTLAQDTALLEERLRLHERADEGVRAEGA